MMLLRAPCFLLLLLLVFALLAITTRATDTLHESLRVRRVGRGKSRLLLQVTR